ncbi:hypothetical protein TWF696_001944 [Orbilia brochopaga]|uniref:ZZ-type domain-containing protein n=1 Tax=Orbilia brochopaga TaxID=3140254 RepID=A0AAV9U7W0_9PEZI
MFAGLSKRRTSRNEAKGSFSGPQETAAPSSGNGQAGVENAALLTLDSRNEILTSETPQIRNEVVSKPDHTSKPPRAHTAANTRFETHAVEPPVVLGTTLENTAADNPPASELKDAQVTCNACLCEIDREKSTFQCLECVEYEICIECYLESLATGSPKNHGAVNHRFETIPPLNCERRDGRRMHWEPFISPDGQVSELLFELADALWNYIGDCISLDIRAGMLAEWYLFFLRFRDSVQMGQMTDFAFHKIVRESWNEQFAVEIERLNLDFVVLADPFKRYRSKHIPQLTKKGLVQLLLITRLSDPWGARDADITFLDMFPAAYLCMLPPGRPKRAMYPVDAVKEPAWSAYKFPQRRM